MRISSLTRNLFDIFPESRLKNRLRCLYYRYFKKGGFNCSYENNYFVLRDNTLDCAFKSYFSPFWNDDIYAVTKYIEHYKPKEGDIVIDAGAFLGHFTLYAAKFVGDKGRVFAFEPDKNNYRNLIRNIELNSLKNVEAFNMGVWSIEGNLEFFEHPQKGFASSFLFENTAGKSTSLRSVTSIDAFLKKMQITKLNFIKMDVEGAELEAIKGAEQTLKTNSVNIAIASYHVVNGEQSYIKLEKMLSSLGYKTLTNHTEFQITTFARKDNGLESFDLICPNCKTKLENRGAELCCPKENITWHSNKNILCFYSLPSYWGEIPREEMAAILNQMNSGVCWKDALKESDSRVVKEKYSFITDEWRANWHWFLPLGKNARVLDIGSGMGTISAGLAGRFGEIWAVEPVAERAEFCRIRMEQDNIKNVKVIQSDLYHLPFPENSFDLVVMNGVLEWLGSAEKEGRPGDWQKKGLDIALRLLRPGGYLYIGIENRFGYDTFLGRTDHSGLKFTALMPRFLADLYCRFFSGKPYRTYIYGKPGYKNLLKDAGFEAIRFLYPLGSYNYPYVIFESVRLLPAFRRQFNFRRSFRRKILLWIETFLCRTELLSFFFSDFLIFAQKGKPVFPEPSPVNALALKDSADLNKTRVFSFCLSRVLPNFFVFKSSYAKPKMLLRFTAEEKYADIMKNTVSNLKHLHRTLPKAISGSIPAILETGTSGNYSYLKEQIIISRHFSLLSSLGKDELDLAGKWLVEFYQNTHFVDKSRLSSEIMLSWETAKKHFPSLSMPEYDAGYLQHCRIISKDLGNPSPQHGDFWMENIGIDNQNRLIVYDWSSFGKISLPGFDAVHFIITLLVRHYARARDIDAENNFDITTLLFKNNLCMDWLKKYLPLLGVNPDTLVNYLPAYYAAYIQHNASENVRDKMVSIYKAFLEFQVKQ